MNGITASDCCHRRIGTVVNVESEAPGRLESVRTLLNTRHIRNDTRSATDDLPSLLADRSVWKRAIPDIRFPDTDAGRSEMLHVRTAIRAAIAHDTSKLDAMLTDVRWQIGLREHGPVGAVDWSADPPSITGDALAIVTQAAAAQTWARLRACPDCQWVFYDTSRNGRRIWCAMTAADGARGCGSIAKTRAYRQRAALR